MVETLVRHGADMNTVSETHTTPVHAACIRNNTDVVSFLAENGADINLSDNDGKTCLMSSLRSVDLCRLLLQQGAAINALDNRGNSAILCAINAQSEPCFDTVRLLMENGADASVTNESGDYPLQAAALFGSDEIVEYLVQKMKPTPEQTADTYSLLAATLTMSRIAHRRHRALDYWLESSKIIEKEDLVEADSVVPKAAYNFAVEARGVESLMNIAQNVDAMKMQALVVRERILGPHHPNTIQGIWSATADELDNRRSLCLLQHALRNIRPYPSRPRMFDYDNMSTSIYLSVLLKLWSIGQENPASISFEDVSDLLECLAVENADGMSFPTSPTHLRDAELLRLASHLVDLLCSRTLTEAETSTFRRLVQMRFRTANSETFLHVAVSQRMSSALVERLIEGGADVNEVDSAGNTPLHVAVFNPPLWQLMREDWLKTIEVLLNHGTHVDVANAKREVAADWLPDNFDVFNHVSLQCLAARAIRTHKLPYRGILPKPLTDFVDYH